MPYLCNVLLNYTVLSWFDISSILKNKDPFSLTATFRFGNKGFIFPTPAECLKISITERKDHHYDSMSAVLLTQLACTMTEGTHCIP